MPILAAETQLYPDNLLGQLVNSSHPCADDQGSCDRGSSDRAAGGNQGSFDQDFSDQDVWQDRTWWVAHTKPRQEKSLARALEEHKVGFNLPQVPKTSVVRGRKVTAHLPLFTSYVFIFGNEFDRHTSMTTNRIAYLMAVPDPHKLTRQLFDLSRLVTAGAPLTVESRLKAGDRVRVKSGAFAGVEGTIVARRRKCRLIVAISLIQQGVSVEIDDHLLEPI
jgi:transcriptional antiterminator RfaH